MSDFSKRPFVAGSLIGLRAFDVDLLGRLVGPSYAQVFQPGENHAICYNLNALAIQMAQMERSIARVTGKPVRAMPPLPEKRTDKSHQVGNVKCGCGFYAYFDGTNTYERNDRITAVVEGYGVCSVGDRGFRAEKARLVALIDPSSSGGRRHPRWFDRLSDWSYESAAEALIGVGSGIGGIAVGALAFVAMPWTLPLLLLAAFGIATAVVMFMAGSHGIDRHYPRVSDMTRCHDQGVTGGVDVARVRENYPDVPVYPNVPAALKEHPLTPPPTPPAPTPETHEDFWTMEVPQ